tara:strand:+ start:637 stop:2538 length:1902 start_codon:yes stop_codon:yes gene_type:complete
MDEPIIRFLTNEAGEKEGLGDAGIETFRDAPYASCAREAGQNSRDAAREILPVRISFNILYLDHDNFPSHDVLQEAIVACNAEAVQEREKEFFRNASDVIEKASIPVLEIADYNTKGLIGPPDEEGTPFHSLVKATGVTSKDTVDSGGSFGIGKNASFAVSDLQTVFYATTWGNPATDSEAFAAQGKIKLVSHTGSDGKKRRAIGYWGNPDGFRAITNRALVPEWMNRAEIGTSIFCMGFRAAADWSERMTYSLISNFFCAIQREEMVFEVDDGKINVNRNTLESLLTRKDIVDAAERAGHQADMTFAEQLYRCLVSENAEEQILTVPGLGEMRVRVLIEEGMPRRVGFIRNGMLITDNLRHFGHALARFPGSRDFVVLVEPAEIDSGVLLKKLENPAHDGFSAERIADAGKRAAATAAMRRLGTVLREIIRSTTGVTHEGAVVLDELGRFFAETGKADTPPDPDAEHDPERYTYESQRRTPKARPAPAPAGGQKGGSGGAGTGSGGNGGGAGTATGSGSGGHGARGDREPVLLRDIRNRIRPGTSGAAVSRELHFSPVAAGTIELTVQATGVNAPENLYVASADAGTARSGSLTLEVKQGERCSVTVTFDEPYDGPIELIAVTQSETTEVPA